MYDQGKGSNLFDQKIQFADRHALGVLQREHPEWFVQNPADATSAANLIPHRHASERVDAAYVMANSNLGKVSLQAGLRYERTKSESLIYEQNQPRTRKGTYDDYFLSAAVRYRFTENFMAIASYSQSILRADLTNQSAVATINEEAMTGTIPNPDLRPEHGDNYSVRVEYYFEPMGVLAGGVFMSDVKDLHFQRTQTPAEDIGLGNEYAGYLFTSWGNAGKFRVKGFELEYNQQFTFLPGVLRGLAAFANYTQIENSDDSLALNSAPKVASGGVSFRYRDFNTALRLSWTDDTLNSDLRFRKARSMLGVSMGYRLTRNTSLFLTGRNILDAPIAYYLNANPAHLQQHWHFGSNWSFGIKGTF